MHLLYRKVLQLFLMRKKKPVTKICDKNRTEGDQIQQLYVEGLYDSRGKPKKEEVL